MCKIARSVVLFAVLVLSIESHAFETQFSGFGSVGGGMLSNGNLVYSKYDEDFASDPNVTFGLQVNASFNDKVSATGQLIAKGTDAYNIEAEWAYVTYSFNESLSVRAGRFRMPLLAYSNYLDVSYAYTWIRPPVETNRFAFSALEGYDLIYNTSLGDWDMSLQFYGGRMTDAQEVTTNDGETEEFEADLQDLFGFHHIFTYDWLTLKLYAMSTTSGARTTSELASSLVNLVRGPGGNPELAENLDPLTFKKNIYYGGSFHIDINDWVLDAELSYLKPDERNSFSSGDKAWHLMLARRIENFTFHLTYAEREDDPFYEMIDTLPQVVANPDPATAAQMPVIPLRALLASNVANQIDTSITVGLRYDFAPATAFKFEVTSLKQETILEERVLPTETPLDEEGTLVNFAIDYVF